VSETVKDKACELLAESLIAWRLTGSVACGGGGAILLTCNGIDIGIERAPPDLPFRWMVTAAGRKRGAISLPAVLRQVRAALDPGYARNKVRVALTSLEHDPEKPALGLDPRVAPVFGKDHAQTRLPS
jgi:hypothetical protein